MQTTQEPVSSKPAGVDNYDAVAAAADFEEDRKIGAKFAHKCMNALIWALGLLAFMVCICGFLAWRVAYPPMKYFTTENGRVTPIYPLDEPAFSQSDVAHFGADVIRKSFTLDFVHFKNQMTALGDLYSEQGYEGYYQALISSNLLAAVRDKRMNLDVDVGPGVIRSRGQPGGVFTWEFQYPVTLKLQGQQTSSPPQRFIYTLRIQRVDVQRKNAGLEVIQVITNSMN